MGGLGSSFRVRDSSSEAGGWKTRVMVPVDTDRECSIRAVGGVKRTEGVDGDERRDGGEDLLLESSNERKQLKIDI